MRALARAKTPPKPPSKATLTRRANKLREAMALRPFTVLALTDYVKITLNNLETRNELNRHEGGWRGAADVRKAQKKRLDEALLVARHHFPPGLPARATFVRLAPAKLDELVNLPASLKRVEDSICKHFGVDDGPGCPIARRCDQRVRSNPGVEVVLEWRRRPEDAPRCRAAHPGLRVTCCLAGGHKGAHWDDDGEVSWDSEEKASGT